MRSANLVHYALLTATAGEHVRKLVGFTRVITDGVTFGYLTDVYVLPDHQHQGLARWMMNCLNEILEGWKALRGFWLLSADPRATKLYRSTLGTASIGTCRLAPSASDTSILAKFGSTWAQDQ